MLTQAIWRDYYENRTDNLRPLGKWAFEFFRMVNETKSQVLISEVVLDELKNYFTEEKVKSILSVVDTHLLFVINYDDAIHKKAKILAWQRKVPRGDAAHTLLAKKYSAVLISRDKHFVNLLDICHHAKPEDLL